MKTENLLLFIRSKEKWLLKNYSIIQEQKSRWVQKKLLSGEAFPFLGKELSLRPVITLHSNYFFSRAGDALLLHVPKNEWSADIFLRPLDEHRGLLFKYYQRESQKYLLDRLWILSEQTGLTPQKVSWSFAKRRWGSCSSLGEIRLNWKMIVFAPEIIDYILVHELSHLQHMNHGAKFWALVEQHLPSYKMSIKNLRKLQLMADFLQDL